MVPCVVNDQDLPIAVVGEEPSRCVELFCGGQCTQSWSRSAPMVGMYW